MRRGAIILALLAAAAAADPRPLVEPANAFAAAYREWTMAKQAEIDHPGTVDAHTATLWLAVEKRFKELDRAVRSE